MWEVVTDNRMVKSALFGWLSEPRPTKNVERHVILKDLHYIGINENK